MNNFENKKPETFTPEYLYLELYPIKPEDYQSKNTEDKDDEERGVIVIDIF